MLILDSPHGGFLSHGGTPKSSILIGYGSVSKPCTPVNIKIAGKWMFIPRKMVLIGIDPYPYYHGTTPLKKSAARRMPRKPIWSWSACDSSSRQRYHFSIMVDSMGKSWKIMVVSHWISCFQWEKHWTKWFYWWNNGGFSVAMVDCSWFIGEPTMIVAIIYLPGRYGQLLFTVDVSYQMIHIIIYIYN